MKIKSVHAAWLHVPVPTAQQVVSNLGVMTSFDTVLVRIETQCGIVGYGEAKEDVGSVGHGEALAAMINGKFGPMLVGEDPRDVSRLWELMYNGSRAPHALAQGRVFPALGRRGLAICALSGVDIALWDILGRSLNAPVWRLLGGRKALRMPAYASGGWASADKIGEQLNGYIAQGGFKAVKMRVGIMDATVPNSVRRVRAARESLGPDVQLMCDAHGSYGVPEAKLFCRGVEELNLAWFEEPVSADNKRGMAEVRASSAVPIAAGESEFNRFDFLELAELRAVDVFQPDLAICGGITEAMRIGVIASSFNIRLAPHLWTGAAGFAAGLHVAFASPAGYILEYSLAKNPLLHDLAEGLPEVRDGMIELPETPGLGLTIDEEFVKRYSVT